ncbi:MAG: hypothetical protein JXP34_18435 [Planctomycetes bacterium]|nr:hypothetical protein [Planctomycetota bacterium]
MVLDVVLVAVLAAEGPAAAPSPEAGGDAGALRRVAEAYLANRSALEPLRCAFTYAKGRAASVEEAIAKGPTVDRLTAACTWVISGANLCYERRVDRRALEALRDSMANPTRSKDGESFIAAIPLDEEHVLTDGERALHYDPDFAANMTGPDRKKLEMAMGAWTPDITPWALGGMGTSIRSNPGRWILDGKTGEWALLGTRRMDDRDLLAVECRRAGYRTTYFFDPARGHVPVRREWAREGDGSKGWIVATAVERCSRGRWLPKRVVAANLRPGRESLEVEEIVLTSIDADYAFDAEDFAIEMDARTQVLHVDDLRSAFRLEKRTRIGLGDLEALHRRCLERLEKVKKAQGERG